MECECGHEAYMAVGSGAWFAYCPQCGRHTGPYLDVNDVEAAWKLGTDVREAEGRAPIFPADYNNYYVVGKF